MNTLMFFFFSFSFLFFFKNGFYVFQLFCEGEGEARGKLRVILNFHHNFNFFLK